MCTNERLLLHEAALKCAPVRGKAGEAYRFCSILVCRVTMGAIERMPNSILTILNVRVGRLMNFVSYNTVDVDVVNYNLSGIQFGVYCVRLQPAMLDFSAVRK